MAAMMDSMADGGIIFEEPTLTGHAESMTSNTELPQLLIFCRELREGQNRLSSQLQEVHFNVSTLLQHSMGAGPLRCSIPKMSYQSKKSCSLSETDEMKATWTEPAKVEPPPPKNRRISLFSHRQGEGRSPKSSKSLSSFRQIDACVDGSILRRGLTRKIFESASQSFSSKHSASNSRNGSFMNFFPRKASVKPDPDRGNEPPPSPPLSPMRLGAEFSDLKSKADPDSELSMSALFKHRATELMPRNKTNTTCSPMPTTEDGDEHPLGLLSRSWFAVVSLCLRLTGALPWASWEVDVDEVDMDGFVGPWQRRCSQMYCWFVILLNLFGLALGFLLIWWTSDETPVVLGTTCGLSLGAVMLCFTGRRSVETQNEQVALMSYLENFMASSGLSESWRWKQTLYALRTFLLWCCVVGFKAWLLHKELPDANGWSWKEALHLTTFAFSAACLTSALHLQAITWNGINMMIFRFAQRVLKGDWDCHDCRRSWREAVSLMRVTSRVYQRSFASLCGTTLLVFFATLFDIQQGQALHTIPCLVLAIALMVAPFMAASATAHCARLPSLVSMIDGDEEQEAQFLDLANFLTLCESGFFMWDTRVSLGVMQKFVYFSVAIVSTIGFQLGVFHF